MNLHINGVANIMNLKTILLSSFVLALASPALAQPMPPVQGQPMPPGGPGARPGPFERLDTNKDGVITLDELRLVRTAAFSRMDTNRDGFLIQSEMEAGMAAMRQGGRGEGMGRPERGGRRGGMDITAADTNRDGTITRAEFDAAMSAAQSRRNAKAASQHGQIFDRLDTNRDGSLSNTEIAAAQARRAEAGGPGRRGPMGGGARLDTNNDQKVSLEEWLARPEPLFERGDANRDGRVTRDEAAAIVRQGRGGEGRPTSPW
jgi:hypothetical protein